MRAILFSCLAGALVAVSGCGDALPAFEQMVFAQDPSQGGESDATDTLDLRSGLRGSKGMGGGEGGEDPVGRDGEDLSVTIVSAEANPSAEPGFEGPGSEAALAACAEAGAWFESIDEFAVDNTFFKQVGASNRNGDVVFADTATTEGPQLVRVDLITKNANMGEMKLMNPNGFYCVKYTGKNLNNFVITTHCGAKLVVLDVNLHVTNGFIRKNVGCSR